MSQVVQEAVPVFDLADRMRKAMRHSGYGVQEMADYLGVSRTAVGTWINGRNRPSPQTIRLWAMRCGVPFEWLRDGDLAAHPGPPSRPARDDGLPTVPYLHLSGGHTSSYVQRPNGTIAAPPPGLPRRRSTVPVESRQVAA